MACSGKNIGFGRVWPKSHNHGHVLDIPTFAKHKHANDAIDRTSPNPLPEQPSELLQGLSLIFSVILGVDDLRHRGRIRMDILS